jgi:flavodoxin
VYREILLSFLITGIIEDYIRLEPALAVMEPCVIYFSRTGNTKRAAEAIANALNASALDISSSDLSAANRCDVLIIGTPVEGFKPAKETLMHLERLPNAEGKKVILFCTYALYKGSVFKTMEKTLSTKGYSIIGNACKKGMKPDKPADFTELINQIKKALPA